MSEAQINIESILHVPIGQLAKYKVGDLYQLLLEANLELGQAKRTRQWIEAAIGLKYEEHISAKRLRLEKDTGVIHLEDSGIKISSEVAKKVDWN